MQLTNSFILSAGTAANRESNTAAEHAHRARKHRARYQHHQFVLDNWRMRTVNAPIALYNTIFLVAFCGDLILSWEMYRDLAGDILPRMPFLTSLCIGLLINGLAAMAAHIGSKTLSPSLFELECFNLHTLFYGNNYPPELAIADMSTVRRQEWRLFIAVSFCLIAVVAFISSSRNSILDILYAGTMQTGLLQIALPVAAVFTEIFTGIYLAFSIKHFLQKRMYFRHKRLFEKSLQQCYQSDQLTTELYWRAIQAGEIVHLQKNLIDSLLRLQKRTLNEHYVDEFVHVDGTSVLPPDQCNTVH